MILTEGPCIWKMLTAISHHHCTSIAIEGEEKYGSNVRLFIKHHFYVDDRLKFFSSETEANSTQKVLAQPNALMHKFYPTLPQS